MSSLPRSSSRDRRERTPRRPKECAGVLVSLGGELLLSALSNDAWLERDMRNAADVVLLTDPEFQTVIADAIVAALISFLAS